MIKVQTLRLRGFCASSLLAATSLLALASCSGTSTDFLDVQAGSSDGTPLTQSIVLVDDVTNAAPSSSSSTKDSETQGQDPQGRAAIVKKALENARRSLGLRLFEDARNEAAYALELDTNNTEARDILRRCRQILGEETMPAGNSFEQLLITTRVAQERERALVNNDLALGRAEMDLGEYGRAIDRFERATTALDFSTFVQPNDPLRTETELLLKQAQDAQRNAQRTQLENAKAGSEAELARIARDRDIARELSVERLLEAANVKFQNGEFADSVDLVDQSLRIDPINPTATALRDLADRARHNATMDINRERWRTQWNKTFRELQHSTVPQTETVVFDPARWSMVSKRQPASYTQADELDSPANQAIMKLLEETVLEHNFASATVQDWANYYAQVTGATFFVAQDVKDLDAESTTLNEFRLSRRSVADALKAINSQTGVAYKIQDGLVQLVTPENAIGKLTLQHFIVTELVTGVEGKPGPDLRLKVPGDDNPLFPEVDEDPMPSVVDDSRLQEIITSSIAT
jgi:tetratricopeptide (TPR) repeat protein